MAQALQEVGRAWAAILEAIRMRSMTSGLLTSEAVLAAGSFLPTYSGRSMCFGTGSSGDTVPAVRFPSGAVEAIAMLLF